ncbi:MAG: DNA primase [Rhodospirillaceae bacterium]|jgi:DNA primase|nr:DNA primase [Rhodospirillaceae bacterium]
MALFTQSILDEISSRVSLVKIVNSRVRLIKRGRNYLGLCPFHNEKTPSFTINEDRGFYYCFGCGAKGNVITFEMHARGLNFPEAVKSLAIEAGIKIPVQNSKDREQVKETKSLYDVMEKACDFFEKELYSLSGRYALEYLKQRGIDDKTISRFRIGFSPNKGSALKQALIRFGVSETLAIKTGLLIAPKVSAQGNRESSDFFRGRVMFPITDRRGRVIAFGGRIIKNGKPKYLNSPDTTLYHKGTVLYGMIQARESIVKAGTVIVCEGYTDVITLNLSGFDYAVASMGTAVTEQQIELLWQMAHEPIICLDGDVSGQQAAAKIINRVLPLLKPSFSLRFATLPVLEDPDSLIRSQGSIAMQRVLSSSVSLSKLLRYQELFSRSTNGTPEQLAAIKDDLIKKVNGITDRLVREKYRKDIFSRTISGEVLPILRPQAWRSQERQLLLLVINYQELFEIEDIAERLGNLKFDDSDLDKLRLEVLNHCGNCDNINPEDVYRYLRSCGFSQILDCIIKAEIQDLSIQLGPSPSIDHVREIWEDIFNQYHLKRVLEVELQQVVQQVADDLRVKNLDRSTKTLEYINAQLSAMTRNCNDV